MKRSEETTQFNHVTYAYDGEKMLPANKVETKRGEDEKRAYSDFNLFSFVHLSATRALRVSEHSTEEGRRRRNALSQSTLQRKE